MDKHERLGGFDNNVDCLQSSMPSFVKLMLLCNKTTGPVALVMKTLGTQRLRTICNEKWKVDQIVERL